MNTNMITQKEFKEALVIINLYMQQVEEGIKRAERYHLSQSSTLIGEHNLTVRILNVLLRNDINQWQTVESLSKLSRKNLWKTRQCGRKTINEIEELCEKVGVNLAE